MLKASKVLLTIGLVFTIVGFVFSVIGTIAGSALTSVIIDAIREGAAQSGETIPEEILATIPATIIAFCITLDILLIPGIVFTIIAKKKLATATAKTPVIAWAILSIVFSGSVFTIVGAILMLAAPAKAYELAR